jgi:hypothetical protein
MALTNAGALQIKDSTGDDFVAISHGGASVNIQNSGTTGDWNVTGIGGDFWLRDGAGLKISDGLDTSFVVMTHSGGMWLLGGGEFRIYDSLSTSLVTMDHDGTDFDMTFTDTTSMRLVNPNGGAILELHDSGGAGDAANPYIAYHDSADTRLGWIGFGSGSTSDWSVTTDDVDGDIQLIPGTTSGWVRVLNGSDWMQMRHDGTDFNFEFTNTTEVNFGADLKLTAGNNLIQDSATLTVTHWNAATSYNTISDTADWIWQFRDGCKLRIYDSLDTDYHTEYHDGTNYWSGEHTTTARIQYSFAQSRFASGVLHTFNRLTDDGGLVNFAQADTTEGSISVSGTTINYNGAHLSFLSQLPSNVTPRRQAISRGTVMQYVNEKAEWFFEEWEEEAPEGQANFKRKRPARSLNTPRRYPERGSNIVKRKNEQRMRSKVSDTAGTKAVAGVFERWDDDQTGDEGTWDDDFMVATTGDFIIRVTGPCEVGDLLESNGDGTARVQADDIIRSSTVAKAVQTFDSIAPGVENPELVPCQLLNG